MWKQKSTRGQNPDLQAARRHQDPGSSFIFPSHQESFSKRSKGRTSIFNLDYSLLVIAVYCQAAVWTTANCQLSGLAHCKHMIVLHTACVLFKFTCHQGPWLELCDLAGDFYSCWKLPVIHFRLCSEGAHNPFWKDGAKPGALQQLPGQVIYSNQNAKRRG